MLLVKTIAVAAAALLSVAVLARLMAQVNAARAVARVRPRPAPRAMTKLRQDPRTGIYYPED